MQAVHDRIRGFLVSLPSPATLQVAVPAAGDGWVLADSVPLSPPATLLAAQDGTVAVGGDASVAVFKVRSSHVTGGPTLVRLCELAVRGSTRALCFAPPAPLRTRQLAVGGDDGRLRLFHCAREEEEEAWVLRDSFPAMGAAPGSTGSAAAVLPGPITCACWAPGGGASADAAMLAVGGATGGSGVPIVRVWGVSSEGTWVAMLDLVGHSTRVVSVAWATRLARPYHLLATGSEDGGVIVWRLAPVPVSGGAPPHLSEYLRPSAIQGVAVRPHPGSSLAGVADSVLVEPEGRAVHCIAWNSAGTTLGVGVGQGGGGGVIRVMKQNASGEWDVVREALGPAPHGASTDEVMGRA